MIESNLPENSDEQREIIEDAPIEAAFLADADEYERLPEVEPPVTSDSVEPYPAESGSRLRMLNLAIEFYPDSAMNFVLRGEYFLEQRQVYLAQADFEMALLLASKQLETESWGIINQFVIDRASQGLRHIG